MKFSIKIIYYQLIFMIALITNLNSSERIIIINQYTGHLSYDGPSIQEMSLETSLLIEDNFGDEYNINQISFTKELTRALTKDKAFLKYKKFKPFKGVMYFCIIEIQDFKVSAYKRIGISITINIIKKLSEERKVSETEAFSLLKEQQASSKKVPVHKGKYIFYKNIEDNESLEDINNLIENIAKDVNYSDELVSLSGNKDKKIRTKAIKDLKEYKQKVQKNLAFLKLESDWIKKEESDIISENPDSKLIFTNMEKTLNKDMKAFFNLKYNTNNEIKKIKNILFEIDINIKDSNKIIKNIESIRLKIIKLLNY